jgi:hypothetical protein
VVATSSALSLFSVDDDTYAITKCAYCNQIVKNLCTLRMAANLVQSNVAFFYWNQGEEFK